MLVHVDIQSHTPHDFIGVIARYPYTEVEPCSIAILIAGPSTIRCSPQFVLKRCLTLFNIIQVSCNEVPCSYLYNVHMRIARCVDIDVLQ